jgi:hypothetical protein
MRKTLLLLLSASLLLPSCDLNNYGKKVKFGKNEVYYKGNGVTEADAKTLGDYLIKENYFGDSSGKSVQVTKENNDYLVHLVVDKDQVNLNDKSLMNEYWIMQALLSENVFNNAKTKIVLADTRLKDFHTMDNLTEIKDGQFDLYLKGDGITETQARKLASLIAERKYFDNAHGAIQLEKKSDVYVVNFVYNQDYYENNKAAVLPTFKMIQWLTSEQIFGNAKTEVNLCDPYFTVYEPLGEFSPSEKTTLNQQEQQKDSNGNGSKAGAN